MKQTKDAKEENDGAIRVFTELSKASSTRTMASITPDDKILHPSQSNPQLIPPQPDMAETKCEPPEKNDMIDRMTLELLMNKKHFQRYISKNDPGRFAKMEEYHQNLETYREHIINMTSDYLNDPHKQITTDVDESFHQYTKTLIKYFEMKKLEKDSKYVKWNEQYDNDEDMLFSHMDDTPPEQPMKSFWGKDRVLKKSAVASYDRNMFSRNR